MQRHKKYGQLEQEWRKWNLKMETLGRKEMLGNYQCLLCVAPAEKAVGVIGGYFCKWSSSCAAISLAVSSLIYEMWQWKVIVTVKGLQSSFLGRIVWKALLSLQRGWWRSVQKWSVCTGMGDRFPYLKLLLCWCDWVRWGWVTGS